MAKLLRFFAPFALFATWSDVTFLCFYYLLGGCWMIYSMGQLVAPIIYS